jgi:hypothetical protein
MGGTAAALGEHRAAGHDAEVRRLRGHHLQLQPVEDIL